VAASILVSCLGTSANAASPPLGNVTVIANFDISTQQQPENMALEPNGSVDVTFNAAHQIARVGTNGRVTVLATLPTSTNGIAATADGIVRAPNGVLYVDYGAGDQSGVWIIGPGSTTTTQLAALPQVGWLNGLALDAAHQDLLATDSTDGTVWKISLKDGSTSIWAQGVELQPNGTTGKGANDVQVHGGAAYVSNTDKGTLLRIPINSDGSAGTATTVAQGITSIDGFAFDASGDVIAAQNYADQVAIIHPDGTSQTVLTSADGVSNPTSVKITGSTVYVASGAYFTRTDPNLLTATLN
jgi:sugar lactone lactonase YvrE